MSANHRILVSFLLLGFLLTSCRSAQKFIENGDYDGAIEFCVGKLRGKSKKQTEYVRGLEDAFARAQVRDLRLIDNFIDEDRPENWEKINLARKKSRRSPLWSRKMAIVPRSTLLISKNRSVRAAKRLPSVCTSVLKNYCNKQNAVTGCLLAKHTKHSATSRTDTTGLTKTKTNCSGKPANWALHIFCSR